MADHGELEYAAADGNDYASHEQTYEFFIKMVKVGIAVVVKGLDGKTSPGEVRVQAWNKKERIACRIYG